LADLFQVQELPADAQCRYSRTQGFLIGVMLVDITDLHVSLGVSRVCARLRLKSTNGSSCTARWGRSPSQGSTACWTRFTRPVHTASLSISRSVGLVPFRRVAKSLIEALWNNREGPSSTSRRTTADHPASFGCTF